MFWHHDGTLAPKHVAADIQYEVLYDLLYRILISAFCWLKMELMLVLNLASHQEDVWPYL